MANYDGHAAKRQRTDSEGRDRGFGQQSNYGYNYNNQQRGGRNAEEEKPNHILLMTILNPAYPITVDVIHTICSPSGKVLRIVIFKKNGVQAMVEFDSVDSAKRAKQSLNGADIYSGCCTLKIEYAKPTRLNVYKNDSESWDYTNPNLGGVAMLSVIHFANFNYGDALLESLTSNTGKSESSRPALLGEPRGFGGGPGPYSGEAPRGPPGPGYAPDRDGYDGYGNNSGPRGGPAGQYRGGAYGSDPYGPPPGPQERYGGPPPDSRYGQDGFDRHDGPPPPGGPRGPVYGPMPTGPQGGGGPQQGAVMMVYGLNAEKANCDRLFNLFCLYGNVVRVKFLKSKEGCAMIQMGDPLSVERAVSNLNNAMFFGCKMQLGYSKQAFLNDVQQPFELPDGSPSFKDFMGNRNNRFTNPEAAGKNRIQPPSKILHFFNTPFGVKEEEMKKVFEDAGANPPKNVKLFASKTERSSSGLLEFESMSDAIEALILANHTPIPNPNGKFPYILKLCFSSSGASRF